MLDADELLAPDDFRFKKRMPSRASAVRELLKRGLAAEGFVSANAVQKRGYRHDALPLREREVTPNEDDFAPWVFSPAGQ
jgi:hypothetical protein